MKFNPWTLALVSVGVISAGSVAQAEEHSVMSTVASTTLSGYVDTSAIWKPGTGRGPLPGRSFDGPDKVDGFNLNAVKVSLEKPLGDATAWSAGYKADLIFGPDAVAYSSLFNGGGGPSIDDMAIKQAYVALRAPVGNGLDIKMGVWDTIIGYEFFDAGSNPNYSRSYGFFLEPLHHTGVLLSYKINDLFSLAGGVANSTGAAPINAKHAIESRKTYMGAITLTLPEGAGSFQNSVVSVGVINGEAAPGSAQTMRNFYAGATLNTPIEGLSFGLAWDYLENAVPALASSDAYAAALYLSYGMDKWKANLRADYAQGTDGTFGYSSPGDRNELGSLTATLEYDLWENVLTRVEGRWDRALGGDLPFGMADENAFTLALNAIYKF